MMCWNSFLRAISMRLKTYHLQREDENGESAEEDTKNTA